MSTYARRRADLRSQDLLIPTKFHGMQALDRWQKCFQPDELDNAEYNLVLLGFDGEVYDLASSIDFDFRNERDD